MKRYDIAIASDNTYAMLLATVMMSFVINNRDTDFSYYVHVLDDNISEQNKTKIIESFDEFGIQIIFYSVSKISEELKIKGINGYGIDNGLTAYARLFLPDIVGEEVERILYLDCDMVVRGNLRELYEMDLQGMSFAAVMDPIIDGYRHYLGIKDDEIYINTGMLLIDCERWRKNQCTDRVMNVMLKEHPFFHYVDQDAINMSLQGEYILVHPKYNLLATMMTWSYETCMKVDGRNPEHYYEKEIVDEALKQPIIVHIVNNRLGRPWQGGVFYKEEWLKYFCLTRFKDDFAKMKKRLTFSNKVAIRLYKMNLYDLIPVLIGGYRKIRDAVRR